MRLQDALPQLLLSPVDIRVQLVAVFTDRKLLVVVNGNVNSARAYWLILGVVELSHIWVSQGLLSSEPTARVELEEAAEEVERVIGGRGEHVAEASGLGRW